MAAGKYIELGDQRRRGNKRRFRSADEVLSHDNFHKNNISQSEVRATAQSRIEHEKITGAKDDSRRGDGIWPQRSDSQSGGHSTPLRGKCNCWAMVQIGYYILVRWVRCIHETNHKHLCTENVSAAQLACLVGRDVHAPLLQVHDL